MNKKNIRRSIMSEDDLTDNIDSSRILHNINQKIEGSAALNGGFDKLLYKIDGIEKNQTQIVEKVDKIHEAIYNPDEGLFARIAANRSANNESVSDLEKHVFELTSWKNQQIKESEAIISENESISINVQKIQIDVDQLKKSKAFAYAILKWLGVAIGGGLITAAFEYFRKLAALVH